MDNKQTCICCGKSKSLRSFYKINTPLLTDDFNICKNCIDKIVKDKNMDDILFLLKLFDRPFLKDEWEKENNIGKYLRKFNLTNYRDYTFENSDANFNSISMGAMELEKQYEEQDLSKGEKRTLKENQHFWGKGFEIDEYVFLNDELANWRKTHKCDNQSEITLLKEICIKILEIRREREKGGKNTGKLQKELQVLMKTASVDPAKSNAISSGQTVDRFGVWVKDIEDKKPGEWWEDQEKYKDMDGFLPYIKNYIVRPIRNFFTGTKDFMINGEDLSFKGGTKK